MINETIQTALELSKSSAYTTSLVTLWISFVLSLFVIGLIFKIASHKKGWGNFFAIWFFSVLISGLVLTFLIVSPSVIADLIIKFKEFFA